jgi:phosphoglycolate phosphatase
VRLVGHTEAKYLAAGDRLRRLGLSQYFARVYCRERSVTAHPHKEARRGADLPTDLVELSHHQAKPSAEVLTEICEREGVSRSSVAYVGDSLFKDILMANRAEVYSIWAKYGTAGYHGDYERLVRVSHWTDDDIAYERALRASAGEVVPDATLESGFPELLDLDPFRHQGLNQRMIA